METIIIKNNKLITKTKKEKTINRAIAQVLSFFGKGKLSFKIVFLKKRAELNKIRGYKTKRWEVGEYDDKETVHIFDKSVFGKVSVHPESHFYSTLVHEIAHVYTEKNFGFLYPLWLTEGIAYLVANQDREISYYKKKDIRKGYSDKDWDKETYYSSSCKFTKYLINTFGKNKLIILMKSLKMKEKKRGFYNKFEKIFGKSFKEVYKNYQKN